MFDTFHPRYLIPNAITALSLLLAFTSIVEASRGNFESAAWLIVWCVLLDIADGKVAGWVNARSSFGIQFDSLADLLAFCAAPAMLVYFVLTIDPRHAPFFENGITLIGLHGSVGAYLLCGALRLARYNIQTEEIGYDQFRGLPTTISGAIVSTFLLAAWRWNFPGEIILASSILLTICGLLMVSNLRLLRSLTADRIPLSLKLTGMAVVYGLGITHSLPTLLLLAAFSYAALGFITGQLPRERTHKGFVT